MSLTNEKFKKSFLFYIAILQLLVATWATFVIEEGTFKMKRIQLSQGKFAIIDDEDFEKISKHKWYARLNNGNFYAFTNVYIGKNKRTNISMHRLIMKCEKMDGKIIDHIDGNGLNNQKSNLRFCTHSQNAQNRKSRINSSSKYLGVSREIKKGRVYWSAHIMVESKQKYLITSVDEKKAALAYNEAAKKYFGEFARINIIT